MDRITLYEKYKFIEKRGPEVNGMWKGAHLLLFFLAFVFGSFCTFCFHMLMFLFDEKCVLFPKLMSVPSLRQNIIHELISDALPVDFLSTQWNDKSACLLPTYVPLVSGIFGLIWTTMFLMCSIGSRVLTGLQRPWRVLPPVFLFSLVMGGVCVYTSTVTYNGLQELCLKLSQIIGSTTCTYTVNVATLVYQRRIRGVYQATQLTIVSAWLHTACWLLSALLAVARVILAVDFELVRVSVQLQGNIDRMLERHERQIRTVSPDWNLTPVHRSHSSVKTHFMNKQLRPQAIDRNENGDLLYYADINCDKSEPSLVLTERQKLIKLAACNIVPKEHQFIVKILYNILDTIDGKQSLEVISDSSSSELDIDTNPIIIRQYGQQRISSTLQSEHQDVTSVDSKELEDIAFEIKSQLQKRLDRKLKQLNGSKNLPFESTVNNTSEMRTNLEGKRTDIGLSTYRPDNSEPSTSEGKKKKLKSSLKHAGIQTDDKLKVQIDSRTEFLESKTSIVENDQMLKVNKDTQTQLKKEKQD